MVQTGPKIQLGGLNIGLWSLAYQPAICGRVKKDPIAPISSGIVIQRTNSPIDRGGGNFIDDHDIVIRLAL